jgi:separase
VIVLGFLHFTINFSSMATSKCSASFRGAKKNNGTVSNTADNLAKDLSERLFINNLKTKGKQKARENSSPEADKLASMHAVNAASQALSAVAQSGWKKSTGELSKVTLATINSSAAQAAKHLGVLRLMSSEDVDVERAAASVLGKLMALEMVRCISSCILLSVQQSS